jgi:uncharacterized protein (DUF2249 family)
MVLLAISIFKHKIILDYFGKKIKGEKMLIITPSFLAKLGYNKKY